MNDWKFLPRLTGSFLTTLSTDGVEEDEDVKFFDHYRLDFNLAVKIFPKINLNDDI